MRLSIKNHRCFITSLALFAATKAMAQKTDTVAAFSLSGYIDAYYAYYTDSVGPGNFQKFVSTSPRSNTPSINAAVLSAKYDGTKVRGAIAVHWGDIAASTWAPAPYSHLMEAHVGVKAFSKLWIDGGFFRSHLGTEYLMPADNITSSLAVATFYEPYYESGLRLNFDPVKKLEINLFLLNGYGIFVDNNNKKSAGMGITYSLGNYGDIGYTNYIGDDSPPGTPVSHIRFHNNAFINYRNKNLKLQAGGDYCTQQRSDIATGTKSAAMYSALVAAKYSCSNKFAVYARAEMFRDPDGFITPVITDMAGNKTGYKLLGLTPGIELIPAKNAYVRLEERTIIMDRYEHIFYYNNQLNSYRFDLMVNAGFSFDLLKGTRRHEPDNAQQ